MKFDNWLGTNDSDSYVSLCITVASITLVILLQAWTFDSLTLDYMQNAGIFQSKLWLK